MKQLEFKFLPLLLALILIISSIFLAYAFLQSSAASRQESAQQLESSEMPEEALAAYQKLTQFLSSLGVLKGQFEAEYSDAMVAQVRLLYGMGRFDEAIELADISVQENIQDSAASYFWSGNAFFQMGLQEEDAADGFPYFHRAQDQYRKALEKDSGQRWNIKFNYELIRTALEQAEQEEEEQEFKVLRPKDQIRQADTKVAG